jgi:hypothetical protein
MPNCLRWAAATMTFTPASTALRPISFWLPERETLFPKLRFRRPATPRIAVLAGSRTRKDATLAAFLTSISYVERLIK